MSSSEFTTEFCDCAEGVCLSAIKTSSDVLKNSCSNLDLAAVEMAGARKPLEALLGLPCLDLGVAVKLRFLALAIT